jgi:hypothetical protein
MTKLEDAIKHCTERNEQCKTPDEWATEELLRASKSWHVMISTPRSISDSFSAALQQYNTETGE